MIITVPRIPTVTHVIAVISINPSFTGLKQTILSIKKNNTILRTINASGYPNLRNKKESLISKIIIIET